MAAQCVFGALEHRGIDHAAVEHAHAPARLAQGLLHAQRLRPEQCIMLEDSAVNLRTAKRLGMRTVLVGGGLRTPAYVDVRIPNILALRRQLGRLLVR